MYLQFFLSVNHYPREFTILQKKPNDLGPARQNIPGNNCIPWQKKIAFSFSDPGDTLENKLNDLKPLYSRKKSFAFQKKLKKMLLPCRVNLADLDMTSQYETNLWWTHVNIVRLAEPIRRCVRWRTQVFKIEGFVCKRFLPSPPHPLPHLSFFWFSFNFLRDQNRKSPSTVSFCSETKRSPFYAG